MTGTERTSVALVALAALATLPMQTVVDMGKGQSMIGAVWDQIRYFTNLTVYLTALLFGLWALRGWPKAPLPAGLVVWAAMTGIVYHALLAATHHPKGIDVFTNILQHTLVPLGVVFCWVLWAPKSGLSLRNPLIWILFPMGYAVYALLRGLMDGKFPYFFLNPSTVGWAGVVMWICILGAVFFVAGLAVMWVAKRRA